MCCWYLWFYCMCCYCSKAFWSMSWMILISIFKGKLKGTLSTACLGLSPCSLIECSGALDHWRSSIFFMSGGGVDGHFALLVEIESSIHLLHASLIQVSELRPLCRQRWWYEMLLVGRLVYHLDMWFKAPGDDDSRSLTWSGVEPLTSASQLVWCDRVSELVFWAQERVVIIFASCVWWISKVLTRLWRLRTQMPDIISCDQTARCKCRIQARKSRCHLWIVEFILAILDLDPVEVLHTLDLIIVGVFLVIIILQRPDHRLIHLINLFLVFINLNLMILQIGSDFFKYPPYRFEINIEISLHWSIILNNHLFDELLLKIFQLQFWTIFFHFSYFVSAWFDMLKTLFKHFLIVFNLFFETNMCKFKICHLILGLVEALGKSVWYVCCFFL